MIFKLLALRAQQMHDLTQRVKQVEDDIALLEGRLERLRGRFYAMRGPGGAPPIVPGSRAEKDSILREYMRPKGVPNGE